MYVCIYIYKFFGYPLKSHNILVKSPLHSYNLGDSPSTIGFSWRPAPEAERRLNLPRLFCLAWPCPTVVTC